MKHIEFLFDGREYSISINPMDYLVQDERPQWWLAALVSESSDNFMLRSLLREHGVVNVTSPVNDFVKQIRDMIVEEYHYSLGL